MELRIHKSGSKLGLYFSRKNNPFRKGDLVEIKILRENKERYFLTKFNYNIILRREFVNFFNLHEGEILNIETRKIEQIEKPKQLFWSNKLDLFALIPEYTLKNYEILVNSFHKDNEDWLRIWYAHERGSGRQVEIRRFVDTELFGRLLGQIQAEGTKSGRRFRLEFCNKIIQEHKEFIGFLNSLGIYKSHFESKLDFHPNVEPVIKEKINEFEEKTGIKVRHIIPTPTSKGSYGFKTYIQNTLLSEIILSSLDIIRRKLVEERWDDNLRILANGFFAKLLTGDGTLDIRTKNREYNFPEARIKIVDCNLQYLKDYAAIMQKFGFKSHINEKHISVRAYAGFDKLLLLYRIKAFYNTPNWKKLIWLINENLKGRRLNTNLRFLDILKLNGFTTKDLIKEYNLKERSAHNWLYSKFKEGLLEVDKSNKLFKWFPTKKAKELIEILSVFKKDKSKLE